MSNKEPELHTTPVPPKPSIPPSKSGWVWSYDETASKWIEKPAEGTTINPVPVAETASDKGHGGDGAGLGERWQKIQEAREVSKQETAESRARYDAIMAQRKEIPRPERGHALDLATWYEEHGIFDLERNASPSSIPDTAGFYKIHTDDGFYIYERTAEGGLLLTHKPSPPALGFVGGGAGAEERMAEAKARAEVSGKTPAYEFGQMALEKAATKAGAKKTSVDQLTPTEKEIYNDLRKSGLSPASAIAQASAKPEGVSDELWGEIYHRRNEGIYKDIAQRVREAVASGQYVSGMEKQLSPEDLSYFNKLKTLPNETIEVLGDRVIFQLEQGQYWEGEQQADSIYNQRIALIGGIEAANAPDWADKVKALSLEDKAKWDGLLERERAIRAETRALNSWLIDAESALDAGYAIPLGFEYYRALAELRPYITVKEFKPDGSYTFDLDIVSAVEAKANESAIITLGVTQGQINGIKGWLSDKQERENILNKLKEKGVITESNGNIQLDPAGAALAGVSYSEIVQAGFGSYPELKYDVLVAIAKVPGAMVKNTDGTIDTYLDKAKAGGVSDVQLSLVFENYKPKAEAEGITTGDISQELAKPTLFGFPKVSKDQVEDVARELGILREAQARVDKILDEAGYTGIKRLGREEYLKEHNINWWSVLTPEEQQTIVENYNFEYGAGSGKAQLKGMVSLPQKITLNMQTQIEAMQGPPALKATAEFATGVGSTVLVYTLFGLPMLASAIALDPKGTPETLKGVVKSIYESGKNVFWVAPSAAIKGVPSGITPFKLGADVGILVLIAEGVRGSVVSGVKGVVARVDPRAVPANTIALIPDVGRTKIPEWMSELQFRQLIEDIERQQLTGDIPANRLRAFENIDPKYIETIEVMRDNPASPNQAVDVVLKTAKGEVVGHISGMQRVMGDAVYSAMPDTEGFLSQVKVDEAGRRYIEVKAVGEKGVMFFSPQLPQNFAFDNAGLPVNSPGGIMVRLMPKDFKDLPEYVRDSPNTLVMRQRLQELARDGKLEPGLYPVYKLYRPTAEAPLVIEYEVIAPPGTRFYIPDATWYAKGEVLEAGEIPKIDITSYLNYIGEGKQVRAGDRLPLYILGTKEAIEAGKGVPSLKNLYTAKFLGDLGTMRQYAPWNLRLRPRSLEETSELMTSDNPLTSSFQSIKAKNVPTDKGAGTVLGIIKSEDGKILLVRPEGASEYILPGREVTKGLLTRERIETAMGKSLYEDTGLKPTYIEHIDTFVDATKPGAPKYQLFEIDAAGVVSKGKMIAEYKWWDGQSKLDRPISDVALDAIRRSRNTESATEVMAVEKAWGEVERRAEAKASVDPSVTKDVAMAGELKKMDSNITDVFERERGTVPYSGKSPIIEMFSGAARATAVAETLLPPKEVLEDFDRVEYEYGGYLTPREVYAVERIPERLVAERIAPEGTISERAAPEEVITERIPPEETPPERVTPEQIPSEYIPPERIPPERTLPEQIPPEEVPPERIPPERIPPDEIPPQVPPPTEEPVGKKGIEVKPGTLEFRMGKKWVVIAPPYEQEDVYYLDEPLPGTYKYAVGRGSAKKTVQILKMPYGEKYINEPIDVNIGWAQVHVPAGGEPTIEFSGGKEAAEERWASEQTLEGTREYGYGDILTPEERLIREEEKLIPTKSEATVAETPPVGEIGMNGMGEEGIEVAPEVASEVATKEQMIARGQTLIKQSEKLLPSAGDTLLGGKSKSMFGASQPVSGITTPVSEEEEEEESPFGEEVNLTEIGVTPIKRSFQPAYTGVVPEDKKLAEAFRVMDAFTRQSYRQTLNTRLEDLGEVAYKEKAQLEGLEETIQGERAKKLIGIIKKSGRDKGEITTVTLKQYLDLTGRVLIEPSILTPDKKHVRWEYVLGQQATELGYPDSDSLKEAIEQVKQQMDTVDDFRQLQQVYKDDEKQIRRQIKIMEAIEKTPEGGTIYERYGEGRAIQPTLTTPTTSGEKPSEYDIGGETSGEGVSGEIWEADRGVVEIGLTEGEVSGQPTKREVEMAPSTSVQATLEGEPAQTEMFGEFSGKTGKLETLIDVEKEKAKEVSKPLVGQISLLEVKEEDTEEAILGESKILGEEKILPEGTKILEIEAKSEPKPEVEVPKTESAEVKTELEKPSPESEPKSVEYVSGEKPEPVVLKTEQLREMLARNPELAKTNPEIAKEIEKEAKKEREITEAKEKVSLRKQHKAEAKARAKQIRKVGRRLKKLDIQATSLYRAKQPYFVGLRHVPKVKKSKQTTEDIYREALESEQSVGKIIGEAVGGRTGQPAYTGTVALDKPKIRKIKDVNSYSIFEVDGEWIRQNLDKDFQKGGHFRAYEYCPANEVWVEKELNPEEQENVMIHEVKECELMAKGLPYEEAHEKAKIKEAKVAENKVVSHSTLKDALEMEAEPSIAHYTRMPTLRDSRVSILDEENLPIVRRRNGKSKARGRGEHYGPDLPERYYLGRKLPPGELNISL